MGWTNFKAQSAIELVETLRVCHVGIFLEGGMGNR